MKIKALGWQPKIGWVEGQPKPIRREAYISEAKNAPLDVRGDDYEAALLVNGAIEAFQWSDCEGSIGQHLVRATSSDHTAAVALFRQSVEAPIPEHTTLAQHFAQVLTLLTAGNYVLQLEEIPADAYVVELTTHSHAGPHVTNYYPGFGAMIATQARDALSPERVRQLAEQIQQGARPTIITLSAARAWGEFVIDGHHKLTAYRWADVPAVRLNIMRQDSKRLPMADILDFLPEARDLRDNLMENRKTNCD